MTPYDWSTDNSLTYVDNGTTYVDNSTAATTMGFDVINITNTAGTANQWVTIPAEAIKSFKLRYNAYYDDQSQRNYNKPRQYKQKKTIPEAAFAPLQRRPPPRNFNKYINASDLLEEFIRYAGDAGVRQGEVLALPLDLFVKWLIIRACEEDEEEPNVTLELGPAPQPRCLGCQQFMRRGTPLPLHGQRCATHLFNREKAQRPDARQTSQRRVPRTGRARIPRSLQGRRQVPAQ